jgi:hypothetical protein
MLVAMVSRKRAKPNYICMVKIDIRCNKPYFLIRGPLNGKKVGVPAKQIMVRKNGKVPLDLDNPTH